MLPVRESESAVGQQKSKEALACPLRSLHTLKHFSNHPLVEFDCHNLFCLLQESDGHISRTWTDLQNDIRGIDRSALYDAVFLHQQQSVAFPNSNSTADALAAHKLYFVTTMGFFRKCWPMDVLGVIRLRTTCCCWPCGPLRACLELTFGLQTPYTVT